MLQPVGDAVVVQLAKQDDVVVAGKFGDFRPAQPFAGLGEEHVGGVVVGKGKFLRTAAGKGSE